MLLIRFLDAVCTLLRASYSAYSQSTQRPSVRFGLVSQSRVPVDRWC
ncbi:hypothetical protein MGSAQ_001349 [marine sediment metagenome]|uniref:Uncharacterized protein n=1 Tax=marine sediment metagenome TaxID=412755 RepID=A0A1B6NUL8_9ZZZZ